MIRSLAAVLTLAAGWSFTDLGLDRLRWNARERTSTGIEVLETENKQGALEAFETAARLDPGDPLLRFNAGSAHLAAGTEAATGHLEIAAETAPDELRPEASYNLGNARLNSGDPTGAIEAYEQTLRLAPDHQSAKFNLELALQQQQQEQDKGQEQEEPSDKSQDQDDQSQQSQQDDQSQDDQQSPDDQKQEQGSDQDERNQQLPQFEEQPDMSAEQAAAILEAVENLEREQRRKQAEQEAKMRSHKGKDW